MHPDFSIDDIWRVSQFQLPIFYGCFHFGKTPQSTSERMTFTVTAAKRMEYLLELHHGIANTTFFNKINRAGITSDLQRTIHEFRLIRNQFAHVYNFDNFEDGKRKEYNTMSMEIFGQSLHRDPSPELSHDYQKMCRRPAHQRRTKKIQKSIHP